jgi:LPXTG-motif cell wall-anchored protein
VSRAELELSGVTVDGNARSGVAVVQSDGATVKLGGVTATDSPAGGVFELSPAPGASSGLLTIDASEFRQNRESGIELESDAGDVVIAGTTFAENGIGSASNGGGLEVILTGASNLAVRDSVVEDNEGANGAGLWALLFGSSTLSTEGTVIARNTATGDGGAIFLDTVSGPAGLVSIADSDITENDATRGAGVFVRSLGDGAVTAGLRIIRSTISDNIASGPGGGLHLNDWSWAAAASTPVISIAQSTFSGNEAAAGAGIYAAKADIVDGEPGLMRLINSTISGNTSLGLGGGLWFTPESADGPLQILHSTVVGNVGSGTGDGVYVGPLAPFELSHTIVANNGTEDLRIDGLTPDYSSSWSLIEIAVVTVGAFVSGPGDIVGLDPQLAALADNGGPTFTHRPLAGSRVIDAGNPSIVGAPPTDQRGDARISRVIDIGAVEVQQTALAATGSDQAGAVLAGLVLVIAGSVLLVTRRRLTGAPSWARSRG